MAELEEKLKRIVIDTAMLKAVPADIGDDDDLMTKWNIGSPEIFGIVIGLEEVFGIHLGDEEFELKKFRTVKTMADFIRPKLE